MDAVEGGPVLLFFLLALHFLKRLLLHFAVPQHEMSIEILLAYIRTQIALYREHPVTEEDGQADDYNADRSISSEGSFKSILAATSQKLVFLKRFPRTLWEQAALFLEQGETH